MKSPVISAGLFLYLPQFEEDADHGPARLILQTDESDYRVELESAGELSVLNQGSSEFDLKDKGLIRIQIRRTTEESEL